MKKAARPTRKTINISVTHEMYDFILGQAREHYEPSVSGYLRSLVAREEIRLAMGLSYRKHQSRQITDDETVADEN